MHTSGWCAWKSASRFHNIIAILGASGLLAPLLAPGIKLLDLYVMVGFAILLLPLEWSCSTVARREGGLLRPGYCGYVWWLWQ